MLAYDDAVVESNCFAPDRSSDFDEDRCGEQATTYVVLPSGVRRYICPSHAAEVDRIGEGTHDDHPTVGVCERCSKLTPTNDLDAVDGVCTDCSE